MSSFKYQLKNMMRDKMSIMTFLLPIIAGIAIHLISGVSLTSVSANMFGIIKGDLPVHIVRWLEDYGSVTQYGDMESLEKAVKNPSTQMIGVLGSRDGIRTILAGDELQLYEVTGNTLPQLYEGREKISSFVINIAPGNSGDDGIQTLLIVITMVTAMFMGCTFNAMNIIGEKEDGIAFINEVLPMTAVQYLIQKILLGFLGGVLSAGVTALLCVRIQLPQIVPLVLLIVLSSFIAALAGMFIGKFSGGLMTGIVYIKIVMIFFLAPPVIFYLAVSPESLGYTLSMLLPSSAAFYGLMEIQSGQAQNLGIYLMVLAGHCLVWTVLGVFLILRRSPCRCKWYI